jgi:non-ribosomal peptide synthetase component F
MAGPRTEPDEIGAMADRHPSAVAWHNLADGADLTFAAWHTGSNQLARGFAERGLGHGDRVIIAIDPDEPFPWLVAYAAVHRAGAVAVPVNTRLAAPELRAIVAHVLGSWAVCSGPAPVAQRRTPGGWPPSVARKGRSTGSSSSTPTALTSTPGRGRTGRPRSWTSCTPRERPEPRRRSSCGTARRGTDAPRTGVVWGS